MFPGQQLPSFDFLDVQNVQELPILSDLTSNDISSDLFPVSLNQPVPLNQLSHTPPHRESFDLTASLLADDSRGYPKRQRTSRRHEKSRTAAPNINNEQSHASPESNDDSNLRPPGACSRCKALKIKCDFTSDPTRCQRCISGGYECLVLGPKKRRPPPKRKYLLDQINEQAATIQKLQSKLDVAQSGPLPDQGPSTSSWLTVPPVDSEDDSDLMDSGTNSTRSVHSNASNLSSRQSALPAPISLIAKMNNLRDLPEDDEDVDQYGPTAPSYFEHIPPVQQQVPPILAKGIINPQEADELFRIYFDFMNASCSLLDPVLYTSQQTYWRSPFLFTVICSIASRYHPGRKDLHGRLMTFAQLAAGTALISGAKTVESVSAYILLSLYPVPNRRWEDDRTWVYLGNAIRFATDLNLNAPVTSIPTDEKLAREVLNRTRVWLNCFNLDRSTASWLGKTETILNTDYLATHSETWYNCSPHNMKDFDIEIAGYNAELRVIADFKRKIAIDAQELVGTNESADLPRLASETDEALITLYGHWSERLGQETDSTGSQSRFRRALMQLAYSYARLSVLLSGMQQCLRKGGPNARTYFERCYGAATDTVRVFATQLTDHRIYLRHGPEAQCIFITFASSFIIKILHPKYSHFVSRKRRVEIRNLVEEVIEIIGSPEVVVDDEHNPKRWAKFLGGLLATPLAQIDATASTKRAKARTKSQSFASHSGTSDSSSSANLSSPLTSTLSTFSDFPAHTSPLDSGPSSPAAFAEFGATFQATDTDFLQSVDATLWQTLDVPGFNNFGFLPPDDASNFISGEASTTINTLH